MERHDDNALIIYTDGSCLPGPRRGGYAFRLVTVGDDGHEVVQDFNPPGFVGATNNEMELMACVEALKLVGGRRSPVPRSSYEKVVLYTDSRYVHETCRSPQLPMQRPVPHHTKACRRSTQASKTATPGSIPGSPLPQTMSEPPGHRQEPARTLRASAENELYFWYEDGRLDPGRPVSQG